ncbi:MAG: nitroreductase [Peptococcaceae bacterium BICA1-7]|nr:MAG: nitroreductase [Peptococcaceae bacterium BICA1-7]HBV98688.1 nitroreductase [Desulfotomaculum sp.]
MILDLVCKNRSYRRFHQDRPINETSLKDLVNLARLSASAANMQPLKYYISCSPESNSHIFSTLKWAAYLKDWEGPQEGERPSAYIIILNDTSISTTPYIKVDAGIACQSILLGAVEMGLGGCILASINKEELRKTIKIPDQYEIMLVIALGKPVERVVIETAGEDIKYWRDDKDIHHVPKRPLDQIIVN